MAFLIPTLMACARAPELNISRIVNSSLTACEGEAVSHGAVGMGTVNIRLVQTANMDMEEVDWLTSRPP
jgi:hypothetical protein